MPATLATGQGCYRFFFLSHSKPPPLPQGWPDSYQDDQHCTVCDRRESTTPLVKHLLLHTVCSGSRAHPQLSRGFAVALVNHRMWVYPRSACVIGTRPCRKAERPFWHTTWPIQAVRNVGIFTRLKSLLLQPEVPKESLTAGNLMAAATRCPRTHSRWFRQGWLWTVSTEAEDNQGPTAKFKKYHAILSWWPPPRGDQTQKLKVITHQHSMSLPGPKAGNRHDLYILFNSTAQSIRARVAGSCHLPARLVTPSGTTGKPWQELYTGPLLTGTALRGSLSHWTTTKARHSLLSRNARELSEAALSPICLHHGQAQPASSSCCPSLSFLRPLTRLHYETPRRRIFVPCVHRHVFFGIGWIWAPAFSHLTRSMSSRPRARTSAADLYPRSSGLTPPPPGAAGRTPVQSRCRSASRPSLLGCLVTGLHRQTVLLTPLWAIRRHCPILLSGALGK